MKTKHLFASDIDGTLVPHGEDNQSDLRLIFSEKMSSPESLHDLCLVTGRSFELVVDAISRFSLPNPKFIISGVGTEIHEFVDGSYLVLEGYQNELLDSIKLASLQELQKKINHINGLVKQEQQNQSNVKLSYDGVLVEEENIKNELKTALGDYLNRVQIVISRDHNRQCLLVDLLPSKAGKLNALRFLSNSRNYNSENIIYAGDSGNDLDVFLSEIKSIVVANTDDVTKNNIKGAKAEGGCYFSEGEVMSGVLEGLKFFGL